MMNHYALIDGDIPTGIFAMLKAFDPPASCLYNMPVRADLVDTAPYLVELTDPVKTWLDQHPAPWGIYIASKVPLIELRKHLRKYTYAIIPLSEAPLLFRFYDPRIIWDITSILDDHALHAFMGPIEVIATNYKGLYKQENFTARRAQFSKPHRMKGNYLTLNAEQYATFNRFSELAYIKELSLHMLSLVDPELIEKAQNSADKIHQRMLEHERDVKGVLITNPIDQAFLLNQSSREQERQGILLADLIAQTAQSGARSDPSNFQQARYYFVRQTGEWILVRGSQQEKVISVVSRALSQLGITPMNQNEFHERTNHEYVATERAEYERMAQAQKNRSIPAYLKNFSDHPYFLKQKPDWYYVDREGYAHLIQDERRFVLDELSENEYSNHILERFFNEKTNNRYASITAIAPIRTENDIEDEPFMPETMDELTQAIDQLASDLYYFCRGEEITTDRAIKGLGHVLMHENIFRLKEMPTDWLIQLKDHNSPGYYRVEELQLEYLGTIPAYREPKENL